MWPAIEWQYAVLKISHLLGHHPDVSSCYLLLAELDLASPDRFLRRARSTVHGSPQVRQQLISLALLGPNILLAHSAVRRLLPARGAGMHEPEWGMFPLLDCVHHRPELLPDRTPLLLGVILASRTFFSTLLMYPGLQLHGLILLFLHRPPTGS